MIHFHKHFFVLVLLLALASALTHAQSQGVGQLVMPLALGVLALQGKNRHLSPAVSRDDIQVNSYESMWANGQAFLQEGSDDDNDHDLELPDKDDEAEPAPRIYGQVQGLTISIQDESIVYQRNGQSVTVAGSALERVMQRYHLQKIELSPASFTLSLYPADHDPESPVNIIIPSITEPVNPACGEWTGVDASLMGFVTYDSMDEIAAIAEPAMKRRRSDNDALTEWEKEEKGEHSYVDALANSGESYLFAAEWSPPMFPESCMYEERQDNGTARIVLGYGLEVIELYGNVSRKGAWYYEFSHYKKNDGGSDQEDSGDEEESKDKGWQTESANSDNIDPTSVASEREVDESASTDVNVGAVGIITKPKVGFDHVQKEGQFDEKQIKKIQQKRNECIQQAYTSVGCVDSRDDELSELKSRKRPLNDDSVTESLSRKAVKTEPSTINANRAEISAPESKSVVALNRGRYIKKHLIGCGGYGFVYLAEYDCCSLEKKALVALKIARRMGEVEVDVLSKLNPHRNIVNLLDFSIFRDEVFLALELGDCSLDKLVGLWGRKKVRLSQGQLNFFLTELLEAYRYIKSKGLLNNTDLSEDNVLYFKDQNRLKLTDFGVDWDGSKVQSKIGQLAYYVLTRLSHNCDALPYKGKAAFCSYECRKRLWSEPDILFLAWQQNLDKKYIKLIIRLSNGEFSGQGLISLLNELSKSLESLPIPEPLNPGEELTPFDWKSYFAKKKAGSVSGKSGKSRKKFNK